jgi:exosortase
MDKPERKRQPDANREADASNGTVAAGLGLGGPWRFVVVGAMLAIAFAWAYWPTLIALVQAWDREPDYSHGFLVVPIAVFFLWVRWSEFPGLAGGFAWPGLVLIVLSVAMRVAGSLIYLDAVDGWSILLWTAGVFWLFGGWKVLRWALPAIAFLWFMVPLPYRVEHALSWRLQGFATQISCWVLQLLGQPALPEGSVISLGDLQFGVEEACSGLRIFVGILALAVAYLILVRRSWWERGLLILSVIPVALVANATRIVVTILLNQYVSSEAAHRFTHDVAGWVMIPFAAALFALVLWYLAKLVPPVEQLDVAAVVRREAV